MSVKIQMILRWSVLILAAALAVSGVCSGECEEVLKKAANVCLECIGIG